MWPFFALWDFWFWSFFGVFIILEFIWTNKSNGFAGIFTPFVFLILMFLFSSFNPFSWIVDNFSNLWIYGIGYVFIGVIWSFFHWLRFVKKRADFFGEFLEKFRKDNKTYINWLPEDYQKQDFKGRNENLSVNFWNRLSEIWQDEFGYMSWSSSRASIKEIVPQASEHKENLVSWMALWPFDMVWMALSDFLIEVWNWLFYRFKEMYQKVSDRAFKKIYFSCKSWRT